ncbi:MAG: putative transcriptional regulator, TetR family [Frankiales bacterium]|nr:putative transcriptional regulator, TetR family [Frankiales bacterium]
MTDDPATLLAAPSLAMRAASRAADARVRLHEQEVRKLLDAGLDLMRQGGVERPPRVADIVQAAGLSNQAFYRYFVSKDELVATVIDEGERRLISYVLHQMAKGATPEDQLALVVRAVADQAANEEVAAATRAVLGNYPAAADPGGVRSRQLHDLLSAALTGPMRELGSQDPDRDARAMTAVVTSLMLDHLWRRTTPSDEDLEHVLAFCLAGVRRPPAAAPAG